MVFQVLYWRVRESVTGTQIREEMKERLNTLSSIIGKNNVGNFHGAKTGWISNGG